MQQCVKWTRQPVCASLAEQRIMQEETFNQQSANIESKELTYILSIYIIHITTHSLIRI